MCVSTVVLINDHTLFMTLFTSVNETTFVLTLISAAVLILSAGVAPHVRCWRLVCLVDDSTCLMRDPVFTLLKAATGGFIIRHKV